MGHAIYRTRRVIDQADACKRCRGVGIMWAGTGLAEAIVCPQCGGSGVEPPPLGDLIVWSPDETRGHAVDGHAHGASDAQLQCSYARRNGAGIVRASGEVNLHNVHLLGEMLDGALGNNRAVVVDFAGVSYIDSTGLNMLLRLHERCAQRATTMAVVLTSRHLWRVFSVLSLQDVIRIFPSVEAALQALPHPDDGPGRPSARGQEADISPGPRS